MLAKADRVEIRVLVDNVTDSLSSNPGFVETEFAGLWKRGLGQLSGQCLCCAAHGLSCLITAWRGETSRTLLFDTGPDDWVFERNVDRLGVDLGIVDAVVLSHGHWDHAGAMERAIEMIRLRNGGRAVPIHLHPGMFRSRAMKTAAGAMLRFADVPTPEMLARQGAVPVVTTEPQHILDDLFLVSGEIPRITAFEPGLPGQYCLTEDGWQPDPLLMDERFVAIDVKDKGLVILSACSHAGIVNVLHQARAMHAGIPLHAAMGGLHLSGGNERIIPETVDAMRDFDLSVIVPAHCTGWRATGALAAAFNNAVVPSAVGKLFKF